MKEYKALAVVKIQSGNVILNADQGRRRANCVTVNNDGTYSVIKPIQFKVGEVFSSDIVVNKTLALSISDSDEPEAIEPDTTEPEAVAATISSGENEVETDNNDQPDSYSAYDNETLRQELKHRKIEFKVNDTKPTLVALLENDDSINSTDE